MEIGMLNARVQIQSYAETQDNTHKTLKIWTTVKTVWGQIEPLKGSVVFDTKQIGEGLTHKIIIRYQPYITTENWVYYNNRRFRIRFVRDLRNSQRFLELLCEEDSYAFHNFEADEDAAGNPLRDLLG